MSVAESVMPSVAQKTKQFLFGPETTVSHSSSQSTTVDYAAILAGGAQGIDAVSRAVKGSPRDPEITVKEIERHMENDKLRAAKEARDAELTRTYKETAIVDRWVENHQGFAGLKTACFKRQVKIDSPTGLEKVKRMVARQMGDKGFNDADVASMCQALDDVAQGDIVEDHLSLNGAHFESSGSFGVRAGGLWIQKYDRFELEHRDFQRGDNVVIEIDGCEFLGTVQRVPKGSDLVVRYTRNGTSIDDRVPAEQVFDAETGRSQPSPRVKASAPGYAIQIQFGYAEGTMSQPVQYTKLRSTDVNGNKEVVSETIQKDKLERHWKPDELTMVEQVALGLSSRKRLDEVAAIDSGNATSTDTPE